MNDAQPRRPTREAFDRLYDKLILDRSFVENPDYYRHSRERFWRSLNHFGRLGLPPGARVLDVGGGQFAILAKGLLGHDAAVGDVTARAEPDVRSAGLGFARVNLLEDQPPPAEPYDAVCLLEVIEHLPQPAYLVFQRVATILRPGGVLFLTTPNGYRLRNILYMLANRRILDHYRHPGPDEPLGHQLEYTLEEMEWQARHAGFEVVFSERYDEGWRGSTPGRRLARLLVRPLNAIPHLRNGLVLGLRKPGRDASQA